MLFNQYAGLWPFMRPLVDRNTPRFSKPFELKSKPLIVRRRIMRIPQVALGSSLCPLRRRHINRFASAQLHIPTGKGLYEEPCNVVSTCTAKEQIDIPSTILLLHPILCALR
jgi:hypothetical protein